MKRFLGLVALPLVLGFAIVGYAARYRLFPNWNATAVGEVSFEADPKLSARIDTYFEILHSQESARPYMCAHHFWGRDQKYAYIDLVCGMFQKAADGKIETKYGSQVATRVELSENGEILSFDQTVDGIENRASYNWLFPVEIQAVDHITRTTEEWNGLGLTAFERHSSQAPKDSAN